GHVRIGQRRRERSEVRQQHHRPGHQHDVRGQAERDGRAAEHGELVAPAGPPARRRCAAANPKATRAPADAICANVARHPNVPPIQAPAGTPDAVAPLTPNATAATARPVRSGGASLAAVANRAGVAVAAARAATIRKAIRTGNAGLTAAPALAAVKTSAAETRTVLRGARVIATAASGAVTATVTEKTVTSCPAVPTLTSGERAISAA